MTSAPRRPGIRMAYNADSGRIEETEIHRNDPVMGSFFTDVDFDSGDGDGPGLAEERRAHALEQALKLRGMAERHGAFGLNTMGGGRIPGRPETHCAELLADAAAIEAFLRDGLKSKG